MEDQNLQQFEFQLRQLILNEEITRPLVFKGIHRNWEPCKLTLDDWGNLFKDEKLSVRYGKQKWDSMQPQWEADCTKVDLKWNQIIDWKNGDYVFLPENGKPEDLWIYYDYRYLPDIVHFNPSKDDRDRDFLKVITFNENLKKKFCWSKLGFPERNSDHSTLWIGSTGSYTPCHYDTYSCNLICQVFGRKRWILFPPDNTENLLPTRIPYEESSVYSRINFASAKRISAHAQELEKCTPYEVTLEAGDCLFLPPKWWHYVKSEDFSISVNTWIELVGDHSARLEEAIIRSITSTVVNMAFPAAAQQILNPNEMDVADLSEMDLNDLLQSASSAYIESQGAKMLEDSENEVTQGSVNNDIEAEENEGPPMKRPKSSHSAISLSVFIDQYPNLIKTLSPIDYKQLLREQAENGDNPQNDSRSRPEVRPSSYLEHLVNAIGYPSILKQISEQFLKNVSQNPPK